MKNGVIGEKISAHREIALVLASAIFPILAILTAVLLGGVLGTLDTSNVALIIGVLLFIIILALRQDELAVAMIVFAHIYIDWFLGREIIGATVAVGLLLFLFIRSPRYLWVTPRALWLWCLFLIITIPPTIKGSHGSYELAFYYPNIIFGALVMFWLGLLVARNKIHLRTLFHVLAILGTLLAIHTIIQTKTGVVLFSTPHFDTYLAQVSNFGLADSNATRTGSFFENPDWNGTFFAMILLLPLGLFAEANSFLSKLMYFTEMLLMSIALLFTYSVGAWIGALVGIIAFILFAGRSYYRMLVPALMVIVGGILLIIYPTEINLLFQHASDPKELLLRSGAWQTAINIIRVFPFTGIGLGPTNYLQQAEPYRDPVQYIPLAHPHNAYLELGAVAGLPVLLVFLALLLFALWCAWRNWLLVDARTRSLIGGGIAAIIALSINSLSINGWTLPPLAAVGWLILGAMASPLIVKKLPSDRESEIQA